jgi:hypothetical protein
MDRSIGQPNMAFQKDMFYKLLQKQVHVETKMREPRFRQTTNWDISNGFH